MASPENSKPGFLKDLAELAVERNSYPGNPGSGEIARQIQDGEYPGQDFETSLRALSAETAAQVTRSLAQIDELLDAPYDY